VLWSRGFLIRRERTVSPMLSLMRRSNSIQGLKSSVSLPEGPDHSPRFGSPMDAVCCGKPVFSFHRRDVSRGVLDNTVEVISILPL